MRLAALIYFLIFNRLWCAGQITGPYTVDDGLAQGFITSIVQDTDGFIWAGTYNGLSRFDGIYFKNVQSKPANSANTLISNKIRHILKDNDGRMWVMNGNIFQVYHVQNGDFLTPQYFLSNKIDGFNDACFDRQNRLWVLGNKTLYCFRIHGAGALPETELIKTIPMVRPEFSEIRTVYAAGDTVWIGTNGGLWEYDNQTGKLSKNTLLNCSAVNQIWEDKNHGGIWVQSFSGSGLIYFDSPGLRHQNNNLAALSTNSKQVRWFPEIKSSSAAKFRGAFLNHLTYIVSDNALWRWDGKQISKELELPFQAISGFQDTQGNIWLGTNAAGLYKVEVNKKYIQPFWKGRVVSEPLAEDRRGNVFSLLEKGCNQLVVDGKMPFHLPKMKKTAVNREGELWYLDCENQLCNEQGKRWRINARAPSETVNFMDCMADGSVVFVTAQQICWKNTISGKEISIATLPERTKINDMLQVNCLRQTNDGRIWLGMNNGLLVVEADWNQMSVSAKFYECGKELPAPEILSLEIVPEQTVWLGTLGGFYRFDLPTGNLTHIVTPDITAKELVYCMQHDQEGQLWLGTNAGLKMYDPGSGASGWFDTSDGLPANEFNRNTGFLTTSGEVLMGTVEGAIRFFPSNLAFDPQYATMVFSDLVLNDSTMNINARGGVLYCNERDRLTLRFSLLDFFGVHHRNYRFRILGISSEWQTTQNASVNLAALRPGTYVLEVAGSLGKSQWSVPARIEIVVRMVLWKKMAICGLVLTLAGLSAFFINRRRLKKAPGRSLSAAQQEDVFMPEAADVKPIPMVGDKVSELIEQHFRDSEFNVVDIQNKLKISRAHLHRKMLEETGETTAALLKKRRLDEAVFLLLEYPEMTVSQVAYGAGFSDPNYFSTVFTANFGMSPKKYRSNAGAQPE